MFLQNDDTPLHRAAYAGNPEAVTMVLDKGCDINGKNKVS